MQDYELQGEMVAVLGMIQQFLVLRNHVSPNLYECRRVPILYFNPLLFRNSLKSVISSNHCLISVAGKLEALTECRCVARLGDWHHG